MTSTQHGRGDGITRPPEWIEQHIPGGPGSDFGRLCVAILLDEYGGPLAVWLLAGVLSRPPRQVRHGIDHLLALFVRAGGSRLSRQEWAAVAASAVGLLMLGLSLSAGAAHAAPGSWGPPLAWVLVSVVLAVAAASPAAAVLRPGSGLAMAAGLLYSAGDVVTKAAVGGTSPVIMFALLLPACHGLAFISLQLSFQRGTTLATAGVSTLLTNILPILAGLIIFAEHLPGGVPGILRGLGFTSAILGAAMLARRGSPDHDDSTRPGKRHRRQAHATFQGNELSPDPGDVSAGTGRVRAGG